MDPRVKPAGDGASTAPAAYDFGVHSRARFTLGVMYGEGRGVPQDYAEAARWYRRAAEQGDARRSTISASPTPAARA